MSTPPPNQVLNNESQVILATQDLPAIQRANALRQVSAKIRENADKIAHVISEEQGKVLPLAKVEAAFTADYLSSQRGRRRQSGDRTRRRFRIWTDFVDLHERHSDRHEGV
jgi:acyl-CoA reductase-like NAD-dependent aldehyde dehydrogenase